MKVLVFGATGMVGQGVLRECLLAPDVDGVTSVVRRSTGKTDPKLQILQDFTKIVAFYGYPGPSTTPIQEIVNTFIFPDMVTRVARGKESIEDSIKWGVGEYRRVYAKHKRA